MSDYWDNVQRARELISGVVERIFDMHEGDPTTVENVSVSEWYKDIAKELSAESSGVFSDKASAGEVIQVPRDATKLKPFFEKYNEKSKIDLITDITTGKKGDELVDESRTLIKALGYEYENQSGLAKTIGDIYDAYNDPYSELIKTSDRLNRFGFSAQGHQLETEAGLVSGIRGRSIFVQGDRGSEFIPMTGSFTKDQVIKQAQYADQRLTSGRPYSMNDGVSYWNINNKNTEELDALFTKLDITEIGARADMPDLATLDVAMVSHKSQGGIKRLYTEFTQTLSAKQRMGVTSALTMAEKRTLLDTENYWGADVDRGIWKDAAEYIGADTGRTKQEVGSAIMEMSQAEKVKSIGELVQSKTSLTFRSGYAVQDDVTELLAGGSTMGKRGKEFGFVQGKTTEETMDSLYGYFSKLRSSHEAGYLLSGYNIRQHDLPGMGFMTSLMGEYYEGMSSAAIDEGDITKYADRAAEMFEWGGKLDSNGELITNGSFLDSVLSGKSKAVDLTSYQRLMPILNKDGSFYLGEMMFDDEQKLLDAAATNGMGTIDVAKQIARQRITRQVEYELSGSSNKLIAGLTSEEASSLLIEETFDGRSSLAANSFFDQMGINDELYEMKVSNFYQKYHTGDITREHIEDALRTSRTDTLTQAFFGNDQAQYVASADRGRIVNQASVHLGFEKYGGDLSREEWDALRYSAHEAKEDTILERLFDMLNVKRVRREGRLVQGFSDIIPEEQWKVDMIEDWQAEKTALGENKYDRAVLDFKPKFLTGDTIPEEINYILKSKKRRAMKDKSNTVQNFIDDITGVQRDESLTAAEKFAKQSGIAAKATSKAYDDAHVSMFDKIGKELDMTPADAAKAVENFKFAQKGIVIAGLSIAAIAAVTHKIKDKTTSYDSWKMGPTEEPMNNYKSASDTRYQQEMAGMGDMALESSNRRNYSYNMRGDRHDHLFKG